MAGYKVAVAGATGAVGQEMLKTLEERKFPVKELIPLASERSVGKKIKFAGEEIPVRKLDHNSFKGVDIALFSAGAPRSREFAPSAVSAGAVVIDNSSAFRMDPEIPLVVPEVNPEDAKKHKGIIANPNCSTIQMVVAINPIHNISRIKRVVVATYQSVSGAGARAMEELRLQAEAILKQEEPQCKIFPHPIAFNLIPEIPQSDSFAEDGFSHEELKMINETRKIMHEPHMRIVATTVRVPIFISHSEVVHLELVKPVELEEVRNALREAPGVTLMDEPAEHVYPTPLYAAGKDDVFVGRIRLDPSVDNGIVMWVVSDNLRKGAALNAVQIAELLINRGWL